jgi:hypothetical protein
VVWLALPINNPGFRFWLSLYDYSPSLMFGLVWTSHPRLIHSRRKTKQNETFPGNRQMPRWQSSPIGSMLERFTVTGTGIKLGAAMPEEA